MGLVAPEANNALVAYISMVLFFPCVSFFCFCSALPRGLHCDGDLVVESDGCGDVVDDYDTARKAFVSLAASWMALMNNWESDVKFNEYIHGFFLC